jgi:hypothetical protein
MDTRSISAILLKVTGLVLILYCVAQLPAYFALRSPGYDFSVAQLSLTVAATLGPLAILGVILWFFPGTITNKIVSNGSVESPAMDGRQVEIVALTIVGVFLVAEGLIGAVHDITLFVAFNRQSDIPMTIPSSVFAHVAATVAEILIGLTLCIGAKGIAEVIRRLRR